MPTLTTGPPRCAGTQTASAGKTSEFFFVYDKRIVFPLSILPGHGPLSFLYSIYSRCLSIGLTMPSTHFKRTKRAHNITIARTRTIVLRFLVHPHWHPSPLQASNPQRLHNVETSSINTSYNSTVYLVCFSRLVRRAQPSPAKQKQLLQDGPPPWIPLPTLPTLWRLCLLLQHALRRMNQPSKPRPRPTSLYQAVLTTWISTHSLTISKNSTSLT